MKTKKLLSLACLAAGLIFGQSLMTGSFAAETPIKALDRDGDGTLDLEEAKSAGAAAFDRLDRDHDGTLDKNELGARIDKSEFKSADPDNDGALTKDEYLSLVETLFKKADHDNEGTIDAKELRSRAGRELLRAVR